MINGYSKIRGAYNIVDNDDVNKNEPPVGCITSNDGNSYFPTPVVSSDVPSGIHQQPPDGIHPPPSAASWNYNPYFGGYYNYYPPNNPPQPPYELSGYTTQYENQKYNSQYPQNVVNQPTIHSGPVLHCCDPRCQLLPGGHSSKFGSSYMTYPTNKPQRRKIKSHDESNLNNYDAFKTQEYSGSKCVSYVPAPHHQLQNDLNKYISHPSNYDVYHHNVIRQHPANHSLDPDYYTNVGGKSYCNRHNNSYNKNFNSAANYYPTSEQAAPPHPPRQYKSSISNDYRNLNQHGILFNRLLDPHDKQTYDPNLVTTDYYSYSRQPPPPLPTNYNIQPDYRIYNKNATTEQYSADIPILPHFETQQNPASIIDDNNKNIEKSSKNQNIDVREFLSTWDDVEDEKGTTDLSLPTTVVDQQPVIVLDCTTLEADALDKVKEKLATNFHCDAISAVHADCNFVPHGNAVTVLKLIDDRKDIYPSPENNSAAGGGYVSSRPGNEKLVKISSNDELGAVDGRCSSGSKRKEEMSYDLVEMTERFVNTVGRFFNNSTDKLPAKSTTTELTTSSSPNSSNKSDCLENTNNNFVNLDGKKLIPTTTNENKLCIDLNFQKNDEKTTEYIVKNNENFGNKKPPNNHEKSSFGAANAFSSEYNNLNNHSATAPNLAQTAATENKQLVTNATTYGMPNNFNTYENVSCNVNVERTNQDLRNSYSLSMNYSKSHVTKNQDFPANVVNNNNGGGGSDVWYSCDFASKETDVFNSTKISNRSSCENKSSSNDISSYNKRQPPELNRGSPGNKNILEIGKMKEYDKDNGSNNKCNNNITENQTFPPYFKNSSYGNTEQQPYYNSVIQKIGFGNVVEKSDEWSHTSAFNIPISADYSRQEKSPACLSLNDVFENDNIFETGNLTTVYEPSWTQHDGNTTKEQIVLPNGSSSCHENKNTILDDSNSDSKYDKSDKKNNNNSVISNYFERNDNDKNLETLWEDIHQKDSVYTTPLNLAVEQNSVRVIHSHETSSSVINFKNSGAVDLNNLEQSKSSKVSPPNILTFEDENCFDECLSMTDTDFQKNEKSSDDVTKLENQQTNYFENFGGNSNSNSGLEICDQDSSGCNLRTNDENNVSVIEEITNVQTCIVFGSSEKKKEICANDDSDSERRVIVDGTKTTTNNEISKYSPEQTDEIKTSTSTMIGGKDMLDNLNDLHLTENCGEIEFNENHEENFNSLSTTKQSETFSAEFSTISFDDAEYAFEYSKNHSHDNPYRQEIHKNNLAIVVTEHNTNNSCSKIDLEFCETKNDDLKINEILQNQESDENNVAIENNLDNSNLNQDCGKNFENNILNNLEIEDVSVKGLKNNFNESEASNYENTIIVANIPLPKENYKPQKIHVNIDEIPNTTIDFEHEIEVEKIIKRCEDSETKRDDNISKIIAIPDTSGSLSDDDDDNSDTDISENFDNKKFLYKDESINSFLSLSSSDSETEVDDNSQKSQNLTNGGLAINSITHSVNDLNKYDEDEKTVSEVLISLCDNITKNAKEIGVQQKIPDETAIVTASSTLEVPIQFNRGIFSPQVDLNAEDKVIVDSEIVEPKSNSSIEVTEDESRSLDNKLNDDDPCDKIIIKVPNSTQDDVIVIDSDDECDKTIVVDSKTEYQAPAINEEDQLEKINGREHNIRKEEVNSEIFNENSEQIREKSNYDKICLTEKSEDDCNSSMCQILIPGNKSLASIVTDYSDKYSTSNKELNNSLTSIFTNYGDINSPGTDNPVDDSDSDQNKSSSLDTNMLKRSCDVVLEDNSDIKKIKLSEVGIIKSNKDSDFNESSIIQSSVIVSRKIIENYNIGYEHNTLPEKDIDTNQDICVEKSEYCKSIEKDKSYNNINQNILEEFTNDNNYYEDIEEQLNIDNDCSDLNGSNQEPEGITQPSDKFYPEILDGEFIHKNKINMDNELENSNMVCNVEAERNCIDTTNNTELIKENNMSNEDVRNLHETNADYISSPNNFGNISDVQNTCIDIASDTKENKNECNLISDTIKNLSNSEKFLEYNITQSLECDENGVKIPIKKADNLNNKEDINMNIKNIEESNNMESIDSNRIMDIPQYEPQTRKELDEGKDKYSLTTRKSVICNFKCNKFSNYQSLCKNGTNTELNIEKDATENNIFYKVPTLKFLALQSLANVNFMQKDEESLDSQLACLASDVAEIILHANKRDMYLSNIDIKMNKTKNNNDLEGHTYNLMNHDSNNDVFVDILCNTKVSDFCDNFEKLNSSIIIGSSHNKENRNLDEGTAETSSKGYLFEASTSKLDKDHIKSYENELADISSSDDSECSSSSYTSDTEYSSSYSDTESITSTDSVNKNTVKDTCPYPTLKIKVRPQLKVQLSWDRIFNLNNSDDTDKSLVLGPAKIEIHLSQDGYGLYKVVNSKSETASPVSVKVKRLIFQTASTDIQNKLENIGVADESRSKKSFETFCNTEETENNEDEQEQLPKVIIKRFSPEKYESYLQLNYNLLKPVVCLVRRKSLDELAAKKRQEKISLNKYDKNNQFNWNKVEEKHLDFSQTKYLDSYEDNDSDTNHKTYAEFELIQNKDCSDEEHHGQLNQNLNDEQCIELNENINHKECIGLIENKVSGNHNEDIFEVNKNMNHKQYAELIENKDYSNHKEHTIQLNQNTNHEHVELIENKGFDNHKEHVSELQNIIRKQYAELIKNKDPKNHKEHIVKLNKNINHKHACLTQNKGSDNRKEDIVELNENTNHKQYVDDLTPNEDSNNYIVELNNINLKKYAGVTQNKDSDNDKENIVKLNKNINRKQYAGVTQNKDSDNHKEDIVELNNSTNNKQYANLTQNEDSDNHKEHNIVELNQNINHKQNYDLIQNKDSDNHKEHYVVELNQNMNHKQFDDLILSKDPDNNYEKLDKELLNHTDQNKLEFEPRPGDKNGDQTVQEHQELIKDENENYDEGITKLENNNEIKRKSIFEYENNSKRTCTQSISENCVTNDEIQIEAPPIQELEIEQDHGNCRSSMEYKETTEDFVEESSVHEEQFSSSSDEIIYGELHHCLLCHRSYPTLDLYRIHTKSRFHRHVELVQRKTIHAMHRHFTGYGCPQLRPLTRKEKKRMRWKPSNANIDHFYHQRTPLQIALRKPVFSTKDDNTKNLS